MKKHIWLWMIILLVIAGCSQKMAASSEEIIGNILESNEETKGFYGKGELKTYEGDELIEQMTIEEFADEQGRRKVTAKREGEESTTVNDGEKILTYEKGSDVAYMMDLGNEEFVSGMSQKEQIIAMIEMINDSHTLEIAGEEKILDYDTYHLKGKAKSEDSIFGDIELWVEQKTWTVLKSVFYSGETKSEFAYTEINFSPKFEENTFALDLPETVEIKKMDEEFAPAEGSIEEAEEALGRPFLIFDGVGEIENVEMSELGGELNRTEIAVMYQIDGVRAFSLSVFPTPEGKGMELEKSGYKVRGKDAEYWEEINAIAWDEDGLRYSVLIEHPDLSLDEVLGYIEKMKLSSEQ